MRRWTSIAAAAAWLVLLAPPAAALPPGRSGLYGGGALGDYLQFVSARVTPDGGLRVRATLVTSCTPRFGDSLTESVALGGRRLDSSGRHRGRSTFTDELEPGVPGIGGLRASGTIDLAARVLRGGVARGILRVRTTYTDPDTGAEVARCDTGRVAWSARRPYPDAGTGAPASAAGARRGTTAQEEPVLVQLTRRGRLVRRAGMTVRVSCPSAVGLALDVVAHRVRVRRGRFGAAGEFSRPFTYPDGTEVVERYSWRLLGRLSRSGARGSMRLRGVVRDRGDGERIGSCDSGRIRWLAGP